MLLQDIMEEIRLVEKRLRKDVNIFSQYSAIVEFEKPTIGKKDGDSANKFDLKTAEQTMKSKLQSYKDLVKRLAELKKARDNANMNIELPLEYNGKKLTIYDAIQLKRCLSSYINKLYASINICKNRVEQKNESIVDGRLMGQSKGSASADIDVYPLLPLKELEKEEKEYEELLSKIDSAITVANATQEIEI